MISAVPTAHPRFVFGRARPLTPLFIKAQSFGHRRPPVPSKQVHPRGAHIAVSPSLGAPAMFLWALFAHIPLSHFATFVKVGVACGPAPFPLFARWLYRPFPLVLWAPVPLALDPLRRCHARVSQACVCVA